MRFTKRLLESRGLAGLYALVALAGVASAGASCSSEPDDGAPIASGADARASDDGGGVVDATGPSEDADAGSADAGDASLEDAAVPDASPLPVACAGSPCAKSLVTTLGEGFCALLEDGTVACWGDNANGQLGLGVDAGARIVASGVAARVSGLTDVVTLDHVCAIDGSGDSWCWGTGPWLQSATATTKELGPVKLPIPPAKMIRVARSTANAGTACALVDAGVLCWGTNVNGQVTVPQADAGATTAYAPTLAVLPSGEAVRDLAMGDAVFATFDDGTVFSWGANPPLGRVSSLYPDPYPRPLTLGGFTQIDAANDNVVGIAGAAVYTWGRAKVSALIAAPPPLGRALPERLVLPESVVYVATAPGATTQNLLRGCAIGASGALYCWGDNAFGQLGDGSKVYAVAPVKIESLPEPAAQVRTTANATCALVTSGRVFCWGDDKVGQLGGGRLKFPTAVPREVVLP